MVSVLKSDCTGMEFGNMDQLESVLSRPDTFLSHCLLAKSARRLGIEMWGDHSILRWPLSSLGIIIECPTKERVQSKTEMMVGGVSETEFI